MKQQQKPFKMSLVKTSLIIPNVYPLGWRQ